MLSILGGELSLLQCNPQPTLVLILLDHFIPRPYLFCNPHDLELIVLMALLKILLR